MPLESAIPDSQPPKNWVLDTNVVLNAWFFQEAHTLAVVHQCLMHHTWVTTPWMRLEALRVARTPFLAKYCSQDALVRLDTAFDQHATVFEDATIATTKNMLRCRDLDDQIFLDLAVHTQAEYLLSLDRDLLKLKKRAASIGLSIIEPSKITV
jgi:uncharacterized protein